MSYKLEKAELVFWRNFPAKDMSYCFYIIYNVNNMHVCVKFSVSAMCYKKNLLVSIDNLFLTWVTCFFNVDSPKLRYQHWKEWLSKSTGHFTFQFCPISVGHFTILEWRFVQGKIRNEPVNPMANVFVVNLYWINFL